LPKKVQASLATQAPGLSMLPANATVKAFVIGIEDYQHRAAHSLPKVDYARQDAEGFMDALQAMYGDRLDGEMVVDNDATLGAIQYRLQGFIRSLEADDLFVFYYAGHGFYGNGGNRITAWETHPEHIEDTTLLLREILLDPLHASACRRALVFVDACAANFTPFIKSRDVISDFNPTELKEYLTATQYFAMYLSCSPGEKSYPSDKLQHGIWTHFLLKALRGEAEESLGPERYLSDQGLKDYLRSAVRQYMTKETTHKGVQTPQAVITASGSFAIREVPLPVVPVREAGDLRDVLITPSKEFFEGIEEGKIKDLPGFIKRIHFIPERPDNDVTTSFIRQLLADTIQEQTQDLYDQVKEDMALRSRDIQHEGEDGFGSIDTEYFRYTVEPRHHVQDASMYQIVRTLELRTAADNDRIEQIDEIFSGMFDKLVVKTNRDFIDFSTLVDKLEDIREAAGGTVRDETANERVTYTAPDGVKIVFSVRTGRISISARGSRDARSVQVLLNTARGYRFGLEGQSTLLLS
jgi:hypothetical protein